MKRILLVLLVALGLQTQAQVSWCDSLSYTTVPGTQLLTLVGDASPFINMVDSITWSWQVCDTNMCYGGAGDTAYFQMIQTTDTVKVCYDAFVYFDTMTYICTYCDSLVYDFTTDTWVLMSMGNPTSITELQLNTNNDNKMYDLLGREVTNPQIGQMYIRNNKKYIRVK